MVNRAFPLLAIIVFATVFIVSPGYANSDTFGEMDADYVPIKWGMIVLGGYDYYATHSFNPIQRVERYLQARGVPYDLFQDNDIEAPKDVPSSGKYPLQYANGSLRYQVLVLIVNSRYDSSAVNVNFIYSAVGNGTNAAVFGMAAKLVPKLLGILASEVTLLEYSSGGVTCSVTKTFDDGIKTYLGGSNVNIAAPFVVHTKLQNSSGKTVWYRINKSSNWWIGMMNGTYGSGQVWYNSLVTDSDNFLGPQETSYQDYWANDHFDFIGHALNFMFNQVEKMNVGIQGYKKWKGALVIRLDQDNPYGINVPINEEALKGGWVYDYLICTLGYHEQVWYSVSAGLPTNYVGSPSSKVKQGDATYLLFGGQYRTFKFIIYNSTVGGKYDRIRLDFNQNKDFSDDVEYGIFDNITYTGMDGKYYWTYLNSQSNPTQIQFSRWQLLRNMIPPAWLQTYRYYGSTYGVTFDFHGWQHSDVGNASFYHSAYMWDGSKFVANETWVEEMYNWSRNELIYCFGSSGNGFEADEVTLAQPGNRYAPVTRYATGNLTYFLWEYGAYNEVEEQYETEPGFYLPRYGKPILSSALEGGDTYAQGWALAGLIDMAKTLYSMIAVFGHETGDYNLAYNFTPYSDMLKPANPRDAYNFWYNARGMLRNMVNAYYKNGKITLEFKANSTLKDYVWKFPIEYNGKYFNAFSDNRSTGKIKHFDGKYVYVEFSQGQGGQKLEATYGTNPHLYKTSSHIENITQMYTPKNLTLQLWNSSGTINVNVDCAKLGQPSSIKINGNPVSFNYNSTTEICSFNVAFNSLKIVEILWVTQGDDARVKGTVIDLSTGSPIEGVTVTIDGTSTLTAWDGFYSFNVSLGSYTLTFSKIGYATETRIQDCPTVGEYVVDVSLRLLTATLRGTVTDSKTGASIGGVNVTVDGTISTLTASDGTYSFTVILGLHTLTFKKAGYVAETRTQNCPAEGTYIVNVAMALPTATIRGTVTDSQTGTPIGGVNVTCDGASILTAADGSYSFIVNLGSHTLTFRKTEYVTETRNQDCPSEGVYVVNVALTPRLATITGTVTNSETANPLEDVRVTADGFEDLTDLNGVYTLVVRLGLYTLTFTKTGYNVETTTVDCPAEGTYTVDMALTPTTPPPAPEISSSTHPDENAWYSNNSPVFQWSSPSDPSGIAGYSYLIDQSSSTIPDETVDTTDNSESYTGLADGTWYFHIRAKNNVGLWSPSDHYRVNIDTNPPSTPNPDDGVSGWSSDNTPTFSWSSSSDSLSGVAGYYWKVDSGSETWTTSLSVDLPPQSDGNHTFYVRAKDNAGNLGSYGSHDFQISTQQCLVTFYTDPAGSGFNITFQGQTYHNDTTGTFPYGTSGFVKANVPEGWVFDHWIAIGNVGVSSTSANPTTATITCGGTLKAVYALTFDFSVSASPLTRSIAAGATTTYTVNVALKIGPTQTVTLTVLGLPTGATAAFSPASGYPSFSSTLTITTSTSTLSGLYTLTIEGFSGGVTRITTVKLTVKPKITSFTVSPSPFSPNGDGSKDNTTIKASFTETVSWTLTVKDSMSQIVRTLTGTSVSLQVLWDGRDNNGITVPDGAYTIVLSGNSLGGIPLASTGNKKTVTVDTTPPTITGVSVNPSSFSPSLGQTTTISYTLSEACYVTIKIYNSAGTLVRTLLNNALKTAGAKSIVWNGKNSAGTKVPAGTYTIKIWVIDEAGNPATTYPITKTVTVI